MRVGYLPGLAGGDLGRGAAHPATDQLPKHDQVLITRLK